jgi:serine/threonine-protein kinase
MPAAGDRIAARYELIELIGVGGMAEVWRGIDTVLGRRVAVKLLHPHLATDENFVSRFRLEAIAAARISQRNVVTIYDTVSTGSTQAIIMEFVEGVTLRQHLDNVRRLPPDIVVTLGIDLALALDAAHQQGLVHRDVKPANVLVGYDGSVRITDFGIAKLQDALDLTAPNSLLGTASYVSPEQLQGQALSPRSDLYSLGLVLYEAASGVFPFEGDSSVGRAMARLQSPARPLAQVAPDVPAPLAAAIMSTLERDPANRCASAQDLLSELERLRVPGQPSTVPPPAAATTGFSNGTEHTTVDTPVAQPEPTTINAPPVPWSAATAAGTPATGPAPVTPAAKRRRRGPRPAVVISLFLVLAATAVIIALAVPNGSKKTPNSHGGLSAEPTRLILTHATSFDPEGTGTPGENESKVGLAIDNDPATAWTTESYFQRNFGGKSGVGLIVFTDRPAHLDRLELTTDATDATVDVFALATDAPLEQLPTTRIGSAGPASAKFTVPLDGTQGLGVLIWITDPGSKGPPFKMGIAEVSLFGRP